MELWLVSIHSEASEQQEQWKQLHAEYSRGNTDIWRFAIPQHFKVGSLDSLVELADELTRLDHVLESSLRKAERQLSELEPNPQLSVIISSVAQEPGMPRKQDEMSPILYLANFAWNNAKYPSSKSLLEITNSISNNLQFYDTKLKQKVTSYGEARNSLANYSKRAQNNLQNADLQEIISKYSNPQDAINTEFYKSLYVLVPVRSVQEFLDNYEKLCEGIAPRSALQIQTNPNDPFTLWRVVIIENYIEEFTEIGLKRKWLVRQVSYDPEYALKVEREREEAQDKLSGAEQDLKRTCVETFSELYQSMIHLKGIRIYVESVLRYSLPPKFLSFCVKPSKGQEKRVMDSLIRKFMRPGDNPSVYGLREDNEDGEDFLPFVLVRVTQY